MAEIPHAKYFEGIMQLRDCPKEIIDWVLQQTEKDDKAAITKIKKVRGGLDLYFTSQKYMRTLGKRLRETYPGEYKQTRTLHTISKKTGKPVYRVTAMFRPYPCRAGDTIEYKGEQYKVLSCGNQIRIQNAKTGKKESIKQEELKYARL